MVALRAAEKEISSNYARSFPPLFEPGSRILILGSMPGRASLEAREYYAHPQNAFWPIIETLFKVSSPLNYRGRISLLARHRIALWDVLGTCVRNGSLDSSIKPASIVTNNFEELFQAAPNIQAVFFNGSTAQREYTKRVVPDLPDQYAGLPSYRLPSTSPAMAAMTRKQKLGHWQRVVEILECST
ncbi:MAG: DNA-deoxyinosine glycosylase [Gammaproteobacteria bacterium]